MPAYAALIIVVFWTLWTIPVLSAVFDSGFEYVKDSKNVFLKNATSQKLVNNTSDATVQKNVTDVDVREGRNYPVEELRAEPRKKQKKQDIMSRILPMMIIPFLLQTAIIPMVLMMLKVMLIKSAFIGKMAILLGFLNMFRNTNNQGGVFTHNVHLGQHDMHDKLAQQHYGYHGHDEYGAYVNRKRRSYR